MDKNQSFSSNNIQASTGQSSQTPSPNVLIGEVAKGAKNVAGDIAGRARKAAEDQINGVKQIAADRIGSVADALRATGDQLRNSDAEGFSTYVDQAVDRLDAASGYLQNKNLGDLIADAEGFARREPALFLGGVFILGLLGGRFLKASGTPVSTSPQGKGGSSGGGGDWGGNRLETGGVQGRGLQSRSGFSSNSEVDFGGGIDDRTEYDRSLEEDDGSNTGAY